ncbi:hypothetical protein WDM22_16005 [Bradyrhizobium septentrionale]|uniref:hypothetical protein n=1 Tax=Bradyrhizobium septentrionale TaxID=1404411 RepID=UPI0030D60729
MAALADAEGPEIEEPEQFGARHILQGQRSQFGTERGGEQHAWTKELQFEKAIHETGHT